MLDGELLQVVRVHGERYGQLPETCSNADGRQELTRDQCYELTFKLNYSWGGIVTSDKNRSGCVMFDNEVPYYLQYINSSDEHPCHDHYCYCAYVIPWPPPSPPEPPPSPPLTYLLIIEVNATGNISDPAKYITEQTSEALNGTEFDAVAIETTESYVRVVMQMEFKAKNELDAANNTAQSINVDETYSALTVTEYTVSPSITYASGIPPSSPTIASSDADQVMNRDATLIAISASVAGGTLLLLGALGLFAGGSTSASVATASSALTPISAPAVLSGPRAFLLPNTWRLPLGRNVHNRVATAITTTTTTTTVSANTPLLTSQSAI